MLAGRISRSMDIAKVPDVRNTKESDIMMDYTLNLEKSIEKKISACTGNREHIKTVYYDDQHNITVVFSTAAFDIARAAITDSLCVDSPGLELHIIRDHLGNITTDRIHINKWENMKISTQAQLKEKSCYYNSKVLFPTASCQNKSARWRFCFQSDETQSSE